MIMNKEIQQRLTWVKLYEETKDAGFVCRRCGISRPTRRKWWKRYQSDGIDGLKSHNKRPHKPPNQKISATVESLILKLRSTRNLGARRLQSELFRLHNISLSVVSVHKVLAKHKVPPVKKFRRKAEYIRYERPLPGNRIQMDTCKLGLGLSKTNSG